MSAVTVCKGKSSVPGGLGGCTADMYAFFCPAARLEHLLNVQAGVLAEMRQSAHVAGGGTTISVLSRSRQGHSPTIAHPSEWDGKTNRNSKCRHSFGGDTYSLRRQVSSTVAKLPWDATEAAVSSGSQPYSETVWSHNSEYFNPAGRTGLAGRGAFPSDGPQRTSFFVVTRWKQSPDGDLIVREGQQLIEFLAVRTILDRESGVDPPTAGWALPGGVLDGDLDPSFRLPESYSSTDQPFTGKPHFLESLSCKKSLHEVRHSLKRQDALPAWRE